MHYHRTEQLPGGTESNVSFRKKHKEAKAEAENVKISHAQDSQPKKSAKDQSSEQAAQQTTGQQAGQSGQPPAQTEETQQGEDQPTEDEGDGEEDDAEPVPDGTTAEILRWVGDDQSRAQRALDKEQGDDRPRAGLTGELKKILGS